MEQLLQWDDKAALIILLVIILLMNTLQLLIEVFRRLELAANGLSPGKIDEKDG